MNMGRFHLFVNRRRGQPGNRQLMPGLAERALSIIRERYADFAPTLVCENVEKRMRRRDAAHQLALTECQTQRLMNRFRQSGAAGLANLRRGRPGNHRLPESLKRSKMDDS